MAARSETDFPPYRYLVHDDAARFKREMDVGPVGNRLLAALIVT